MTSRHTPSSRAPVVVAVPVCNEEERLGACLAALIQQDSLPPHHIVFLVNNTSDRSAEVARSMAMPAGTTLHVMERTLPKHRANAGFARRLAMQEAARLAGPDGVLLTTDADSRVDPDWIAANLAELRRGADAVAGWVELEPSEWSQIPMALHEADAVECAYDALCDEIHARLDPDPFDPLPRHTQDSGASIAVTAAAYRRVGGIPPLASGEDRAFLAALRRHGARIRHALSCHVTVSGRVVGRAPGGMADTIRRRLEAADLYLDDRLEPAMACARRARLRRMARHCAGDAPINDELMAGLQLPRAQIEAVLAVRPFELAWSRLEALSPALIRQRVGVFEVATQTSIARAILADATANASSIALTHGGASPAV